ncbi:clusterin-associated protein 1 homolog [Oppia nitens]|uniref:clusterin-associated protein 1 homolog n=1 Tax=Oppia nitens TaxID=1686743 RepID=UPI0023DAD1E0|nr:clusterin-associated protein 1 homolog [Oppia nitens]
MSYRELRNFIEILRALGYPRLVSMENFRNPNFPLMAEILQWLMIRFDPSIEIFGDIDTEQDRVIFIRSCAQTMATKAQINFNTKKLYMADGHAVQELIKIAKLLYDASKQSDPINQDQDNDNDNDLSESTIVSKLNELKVSRQLTSEITQRGANVYDLLAQEIQVREQRVSIMSRQLEIPEIEKSISESIKELQNEIQNINYKIDNVAADEANLDAKIERKKQELDRNQKRLQTLRSVRPAFMDEYEKLEEELATIYELYITKYRCLSFLEQQLEEIEESELQKIHQREEQIKQMVEQMKDEELLRNENENIDDLINDHQEDEDSDEIADNLGPEKEKSRRPMNTVTLNKRSATTGRVRMFGSLLDEEKENSLDSDLDLDEEDDGSDLDSEDEMEIMNLTNNKTLKSDVKKSNEDIHKMITNSNDSDNDF